MSYSIKILPAARQDLQDILAHYQALDKGIDKRFFQSLLTTMRLLAQSPLLFQVRYKEIRQAPIKQFSFWVHYMVEEQTQTVVILAVLHSSRDPKNWKDR